MSAGELRRHTLVFEGVVVDRWVEFLAAEGGTRAVHKYHFHVVRRWDPWDAPQALVEHGLYDRGGSPTYEVGQRYLVFAVSDDMPPHTFVPACAPRASGAELPAAAARLGPSTRTYSGHPELDVREWLVRRLRMYVGYLLWAVGR